MATPFFYRQALEPGVVTLDEDTSKHISGVLRMQAGALLMLTDGKGASAEAVIESDHRKKCTVRISAVQQQPVVAQELTIGIAPVKNNARFEWFLEKATEIGVQRIVPLITERTIREKFRFDRMNNILVSAMLQSQQSFMPQLEQPSLFHEYIAGSSYQSKFIAHCLPSRKDPLQRQLLRQSNIILIGPEGDFTSAELDAAFQHGYAPVSLGPTRLRTETAGIAAAVLLCSMRQ